MTENFSAKARAMSPTEMVARQRAHAEIARAKAAKQPHEVGMVSPSDKDGGFTNTGHDIFQVKIGDIVPANIMEIEFRQDGLNVWSGRVTIDRDCADLEYLIDEWLVITIAEHRGDQGYTEMTFEHPEWRLSETWNGMEATQVDLRFSRAKRVLRHLDERPEKVSV